MTKPKRDVIHLRVRPGSALERVIASSKANKTDTVHEVAAKIEAYEKSK